jgi:hypothetical protein
VDAVDVYDTIAGDAEACMDFVDVDFVDFV